MEPFKNIAEFRSRATDEDCKALENYVLSVNNRQDAFPSPDGRYNFSYTSAATELRRRGYLTEKTADDDAPKPFTVPDLVDKNGNEKIWKSRSVSLSTDVLERIAQLEAKHKQYTKKAILDAIIDQGLRDFGF